MLETRHVVILLHGSLEKADASWMCLLHNMVFTSPRLINKTNPQIDFLSATWAKPRLVMGLLFFNHQSGLVFFNLGSSGSTPNVIRATDELREMASHH